MSKLTDFFKQIAGNPNGKDVKQWSDQTIAIGNGYTNFSVTELTMLRIPEVFSAIDMLANDISKASFFEKQVTWIDNDTVKSFKHVKNSKWDIVLNRRPNYYMSKAELLKAAVFDLFLRGGFYWFVANDKQGNVSDLIPIDPSNIRQVKDKDGIFGYEITTWEGIEPEKNIVPYDCVIAVNYSNITRVNDGDFRYIFKSLLEQFGLKNKFDTSQLDRTTTMLAHAKIPSSIDEAQSKEIKENFKAFFTNANGNNSSVLVTDPKVEVELLDGAKTQIKSPVSSEFVLALMTKLGNAFHIPLNKLNVAVSGTSFYKGREGVNIDYLNDAIEPWLNIITSKINQVVFGRNMKREIVADVSRLLTYDTPTRGEYSAKMRQNGIMTTNELRRVNGLPPVAGGDAIFGNGTLIELGKSTGAGNNNGSDNNNNNNNNNGGGDDDDEQN